MKEHNYQPLKGMKVIELASVLAGPSVGMFFAELGAKVMKVENPLTNGDVTRSWKLASEDQNHPYSAYYASVNWGKEVIRLDLHSENDKNALKEELKDADVLISNFRPESLKKLGLDLPELRKVNPNLIYGEILGFRGEKRLAYDVVLQAECGFISMNGHEVGDEAKLPLALIDIFAAHHLKEGLLLALLERERSGKIGSVSVSLFDAGLAALVNQATNWIMAKHIPQPIGTLHPNIAPYGEMFYCKDQKRIVLAVGSNDQFKSLCDCLNIPEIPTDPKFKINQLRVQNRKELYDILAEAIAKFDREDIMRIFIQNAVPAGAMRNMKEVFEVEAANEMLLEQEFEGRQLKAVSGNAFRIQF